ncbi:MAG TPA: zf-HC2 domain-containing protein [Coriobacteriia bacterium]|jgi:hypothetical protein
MCYDEGSLMAYLDGELTTEERVAIESHAARCAECGRSLETLAAIRAAAAEALDRLRQPAEVVPIRPARRTPRRLPWQRVAAAAAAVLVLASFALAPVRSAAASFLRIFRVQHIQTISISPEDLQAVSRTLSRGSGHVDLKTLGEAWVEGGSRAAKPVTLAQAQAAVDFPVKLPAGLGDPRITLQAAQTFKFKLKVNAVNEALRYYGSDRTFPRDVDGKVFEVRVPAIVLAQYDAQKQPVFAGQARSPELVVPDGVDPSQLRDVLLNLPFLPRNVRDQLAAVDDWQSTLLVPDFGGKARDIQIDGVPAVVMSPDSAARKARAEVGGDLPEHTTTVVWNGDGVVRAIAGGVTEEKAIELAKSCMR